MKNTVIYFVRHGESIANASNVLLGHTDLDLSPLGYTQAETTAHALADVHFDEIHSSDLMRAYNTALPHAKMRGITANPNKNLREVCLGEWEALSMKQVIDKYGEDTFFVGWRQGFGTFAFPGGESVQGACDRFSGEVLGIAKARAGKTLLITAHGAVIRAFYARVLGIAPENIAAELPFPSNASYSIVEFDGERFIPREYSVDGHLESVGITKVNT